MLESTGAQLRFVASLFSGRRFSERGLRRLIAATKANRAEFGPADPEVIEAGQLVVVGDVRDTIQLRRFRRQLQAAVRETPFYREALPDWAARRRLPALTWDDVAALPVTAKSAVREHPDRFVRDGAPITLQSSSTGTTGRPSPVSFTARELRLTSLLAALGMLTRDQLRPDDIVGVCVSSRATVGNVCFTGAVAEIGALLQPIGIVDVQAALAILAEPRTLATHRPAISVLATFPSYLGQLTEAGLARGMGPADFGLRAIILGGELATAGLRRRCQQLFGPVDFLESYTMTETWPLSGTVCEAGHLHFEPLQGLVEVLDLDSGRSAAPGQPGTIVATPFGPMREATVVLRYDTQDVVIPLAGPFGCSLRTLPATSPLLGKAALAVHTGAGRVFPRDVLEPLEDAEVVPLPARVAIRPFGDGVAVTVAARRADAATHARLAERLVVAGVPLRSLRVVTDPGQVEGALPWRCDLRELSFPALAAGGAAAATQPAPAAQPVGVLSSERELMEVGR